MDPEKLEALLHSHQNGSNGNGIIKAVIPVHLYGQPAAMDNIETLARKYNVSIVEDAAQSHIATYGGKFVGHFGAATCFSFYPGKNLGAYGEAGAVTTNDNQLAQSIRQLRDHGQVEKYKHARWGHNYRMDGIQGAVLGVKLNYLSQWTARRREIAAMYSSQLNGVGDLVLPYESPKAQHVYHLYAIRTKRRTELQRFLASKEIATALHYPIPIHFQQAYLHLGYRPGDFPASEQAAQECISLPLYPEMTNEQVHYVVENVKSFFHV
jgi:dTDP-4-amino-4,6-dideoxygalactose transaminase